MRGIDFCMMSTSARGGLHTRPMSNNGQVDFDGDVWFFSFRATRKVREIGADPHVTLSFTGGTKSQPTWIVLEGMAKIVDDVEEKKARWMKELGRWFEKGPEDAKVVLIRVQGKRAT